MKDSLFHIGRMSSVVAALLEGSHRGNRMRCISFVLQFHYRGRTAGHDFPRNR